MEETRTSDSIPDESLRNRLWGPVLINHLVITLATVLLGAGLSAATVASLAGINRRTVYQWRRKYPVTAGVEHDAAELHYCTALLSGASPAEAASSAGAALSILAPQAVYCSDVHTSIAKQNPTTPADHPRRTISVRRHEPTVPEEATSALAGPVHTPGQVPDAPEGPVRPDSSSEGCQDPCEDRPGVCRQWILTCSSMIRVHRGTIENTSDLLRQYFPKHTDLSVYTERELCEVERMMNNRPRKALDWATLAEAMCEELAGLLGDA